MSSAFDPLTSSDRELELLVSDAGLARAWFEGVPAARLLARIELDRRASDEESWEALVAELTPHRDRIARAVAKNLRAAQDEGPLSGSDAVVAVLVLAASTNADASLGEIFGVRGAADSGANPVHEDRELARACARYEPRILSPRAIRSAAFEACVRLATRRAAGPWPQGRILAAARVLASSALGPFLVTDADARLYPHDVEATEARMALVSREKLEAIAKRNPMDLAKVVSALERTPGAPSGLDSLIADVARLLELPGEIVLTAPPIDPDVTPLPSAPPSERPQSSMPLDWSHPDAAPSMATAYESGLLPFARLRQLVSRGGEPALDAIGAEMLNVPAHPTASAAFAEMVAKSGRPRDVIRLVTYFAITPDPLLAARVLGECEAPELPAMLKAWLEAMLPTDGASAPPGDDPGTSSAARITACVTSLEPYPHLYGAVRPLLSRVTGAPPPSG